MKNSGSPDPQYQHHLDSLLGCYSSSTLDLRLQKLEPNNLCFNKSSGFFSFRLKSENHWYKTFHFPIKSPFCLNGIYCRKEGIRYFPLPRYFSPSLSLLSPSVSAQFLHSPGYEVSDPSSFRSSSDEEFTR